MTPSTGAAPSVGQILQQLAAQPAKHFLGGWNWKSAAVSGLLRAVIFFATTITAGLRAALAALTIEAIYRIIASGFYGVAAQALRDARPRWQAAAVVMVVLPTVIQALELAVHWVAGTPNLMRGVAVSTAVAAFSSLFSWFAMQRGAFLVGEEARPFFEDLKRYPSLLAEFLLAGPQWLWSTLAGGSARRT
ncbi:MAG: hypothetical protein NTV70_14685 [Acidobacteria bacterium]|nr:hypothetical protein [Acidobacteriota bacterium]